MVGASGDDLRALRDRPFDLLQELERRSKAALAGAAGTDVDAKEWVGIGFRLADEQFIVARDDIREVLMVPESIARVPGAKSWISGLANVRGHLLPIVDLKSFLGSGRFAGQRDARVLVIKSTDLSVGLIVDEVFGFRRFLESERSDTIPQTLVRCDHFLEGTYERGLENWSIFSVGRLEKSKEFQRGAA
ncbi:MAG: chemotaxis protein CheW [Gammaproteobacteria bacterium]|jgi:twitching motility protein PilI|nr:chemotaxis protein CheW [Chromatiales bacterium]MCP4926494.1 chemotaxis protein CheW [Gammaproteobacteria bacterium]MDP7419721.1 chemotaxis protein CheW [Gammaproteobacteria bacterium]MDP7660031.1 chemotaxis protein CheW [Gammaproteobacteria bacterium]HJP38462.1 chemotaxis protein CheW [Gammaproteobacteria bacterium]